MIVSPLIGAEGERGAGLAAGGRRARSRRRSRRPTAFILFWRSFWALRRYAALAVVGLVAVATMLAVTLVPSQRASRALAAMLKDPLAIFASRSPGERPAGALFQTKFRRSSAGAGALAPGEKPSERVLSAVRDRPVVLPGTGAPGPTIDPFLPAAGDVTLPSATTQALGPALAANSPPALFGAVPTAGGGGGGGSGAAPVPTPTPTAAPPVSAVPEPATWVSMILGLALVGAAMRRRGKQLRGMAGDTARVPDAG